MICFFLNIVLFPAVNFSRLVCLENAGDFGSWAWGPWDLTGALLQRCNWNGQNWCCTEASSFKKKGLLCNPFNFHTFNCFVNLTLAFDITHFGGEEVSGGEQRKGEMEPRKVFGQQERFFFVSNTFSIRFR